MVYQSIKSRTIVETMHLQRERYFKKRNIYTCPKKLFVDHLIKFITDLRVGRYKVILAIDMNKNSIKGSLLVALQWIGLTEVFYRKFNKLGLASHISGSEKIDRV